MFYEIPGVASDVCSKMSVKFSVLQNGSQQFFSFLDEDEDEDEKDDDDNDGSGGGGGCQ